MSGVGGSGEGGREGCCLPALLAWLLIGHRALDWMGLPPAGIFQSREVWFDRSAQPQSVYLQDLSRIAGPVLGWSGQRGGTRWQARGGGQWRRWLPASSTPHRAPAGAWRGEGASSRVPLAQPHSLKLLLKGTMTPALLQPLCVTAGWATREPAATTAFSRHSADSPGHGTGEQPLLEPLCMGRHSVPGRVGWASGEVRGGSRGHVKAGEGWWVAVVPLNGGRAKCGQAGGPLGEVPSPHHASVSARCGGGGEKRAKRRNAVAMAT